MAVLPLLGHMLALASGAANSITYTYPQPAACSTITIAQTGVITCGQVTPSQPKQFTIASPLNCSALRISTVTGEVDCAPVPEECKLTASPATAAPGGTITLKVEGCTNNPTGYIWTGGGLGGKTTQNATTVTLPESASTSYYTYSVMAENELGAGASDSITVAAIPGYEEPLYKGPFAYIAHQLDAYPAPGQVTIVDTSTNAISASVKVGVYPVGVSVNPAGTRVYVTNVGSNTVSVIDTATNQTVPVYDPSYQNLVSGIGVGLNPWGVAVNPAGSRVYVANSGSDSVSVIDAVSNTAINTVAVGSVPYGVAVNPQDSTVYVGNYRGNSVSVIDAMSNIVIKSVPVGDAPYGIAVNPQGSQVYVANSGSGSVSVIDAISNIVIKNVAIGNSPHGVVVNPQGTQVYVVDVDDRTVSVIDVTSNLFKVTPFKDLVALPSYVAVYPAGIFDWSHSPAYVTNQFGIAMPMGAIGLYSFGNFVGPGIPDAPPYMSLWWNEAESGWGMSVTQHRNLSDMIFATIFTYNDHGQPVWYVISDCPVISGGCNGDIYEVTGGTPPTVPWDGSSKMESKVGAGTLAFTDANNGIFNFTINGAAGSKLITRQIFATGDTPPPVDYTDLWWNPSESGWGVSLTHQFGVIFATWFAYDASGKAVWYVVSNCAVAGSGCAGDLYRVTGGSPLTTTWNGSNLVLSAVGSVAFAFSDANNGLMSYTIDGVAGSRAITRQSF